ncbi:MAG: flagellar biosynthetic protein FliR [Geminicoccaceae bacterium]
MIELQALLSEPILTGLMVFARLGSAMMLLPGFGEPYVTPRSRLLLALAISVAISPVIAPYLGPVDTTFAGLFVPLILEVVRGLFLGAAVRAVMAVLHIAGSMIAMQSGLASASFFDPNEATQSSLPGNFMTTVMLAFIFATDLHHDFLRAIQVSYEVLPATGTLITADMSQTYARTLGGSFEVALRIAGPVALIEFVLMLTMGVISRLVPTFQALFVALPAQVLVGFAVMMLSLTTSILVTASWMQETLSSLVGG